MIGNLRNMFIEKLSFSNALLMQRLEISSSKSFIHLSRYGLNRQYACSGGYHPAKAEGLGCPSDARRGSQLHRRPPRAKRLTSMMGLHMKWEEVSHIEMRQSILALGLLMERLQVLALHAQRIAMFCYMR